MAYKVHVQDAHDILDSLSDTIKEHKDLYSAHEATLIWNRMHLLTNQMHEVKKAAQTRDWGDE